MKFVKLAGIFALAAGLWTWQSGAIQFTNTSPGATACLEQARSGQSCTAEQVTAVEKNKNGVILAMAGYGLVISSFGCFSMAQMKRRNAVKANG